VLIDHTEWLAPGEGIDRWLQVIVSELIKQGSHVVIVCRGAHDPMLSTLEKRNLEREFGWRERYRARIDETPSPVSVVGRSTHTGSGPLTEHEISAWLMAPFF